MPPRSAKKEAVKKTSPTGKRSSSTLLPSKSPSDPLPEIIEEKEDLKADSPLASMDAAIDPITALQEKESKEEESAVETIEGEVDTSKVQDSVDSNLEVAEIGKDLDVLAEGENADGEDTEMEKGGENGNAAVEPDDAEYVEGDDDLNDGVDDGNVVSSDIEENVDKDPSLYINASQMEITKQKRFEIFVGSLSKEAVEDDLIKVFGTYGDIQSVRIVKNPLTQKSKGFAFILFVNMEHAKKALAELKDGTEIRGKRVKISASQDNNTLYVGNICKTWTQDHVIEALKGFEIEQFEHMLLPNDLKKEGKIKGFALLEFSSHTDAVAAYQRLRKPDVVFGRDISAKVAFTTSVHPSEEALLQVKSVFIEGIPLSWDEKKVKELCKEYGQIERVQLSRDLHKTRRKDFGFVDFTSRDSAVACVEGINNAELGEGESKVRADLAKPQNKSRLVKQVARGGFELNKDGEVSAKKIDDSKKGKNIKLEGTKERQPSKSQSKVTKGRSGSQTAEPSKGKKRGRRDDRGMVASEQPSKKARDSHNHGRNERTSKKARDSRNHGKMSDRASNSIHERRNTYSRMQNVAHPTNYRARDSAYGSNRSHSDLEPHGGYLPATKVQNLYVNEQRSGAYYVQANDVSGYTTAVPVFLPTYPGYPQYAAHEVGYGAQPGSSGAYYGRYY